MEDLKEKRNGLNSRVKELGEERKKLIEEMKALKTIITENKELRNKANEEVKSLKEKRIASFDEIKKVKQEVDGILEILKHVRDSVGGSYNMLKEELSELDWDYQTGVHSIKKEKEMVKQIEIIEEEIVKSEIVHDKKSGLIRLERKLKELYTEANVYHGLLMNRAKESEKHHDTLMKSIREIDALEQRVDQIDNDMAEAMEQADKFHKELKESERYTSVAPEQNMEEVKKKAEEILANFKAGKKVTMEELSLLQQLGLY
jgi:uncharacterized coiled-coil DUF342 family protein